MDVIFQIIGELVEHALRRLGLWVLKVVTFGRYRDTNSYLYFLPTFIGFVSLIVLLFVVVMLVSAVRN